MKKQKYYVVWKGWKTGVFEGKEEFRKQIRNFSGAICKSFETRELAEEAFTRNSEEYIVKKVKIEKIVTPENLIMDSVCVGAFFDSKSKIIRYRVSDTNTEKVLSKSKSYEDGNSNIAQFLAIVFGLKYCKKVGSELPVYSNSSTAISWVRNKRINSNLIKTKRNEKLFERIDKSIKWLEKNNYPNKVYQWNTKKWGEIPAHFE